MEKESSPLSPRLFYEKSLLLFLFLSFFLGLCFKFYRVPFWLMPLPLFFLKEAFFPKDLKKLILAIFIFFSGYFYLGILMNFKHQPHLSAHKNFELLFRIKKLEPYYGKYKVWIETSYGTYTFLTEKDLIEKGLFSPGKLCIAYFSEKHSREYLNPFSPLKTELFFTQGIEGELKLLEYMPAICEKEPGFTFEALRFKLFKFSEGLPPLSKALFQALVLGVDRGFPSEYLEKLKAQGLYHMLAISGFNLAILYGVFYFFWRWLFALLAIKYPFFQPVQMFASLLALPAAFLILCFSGFVPSANRAFLFLLLFVLSRLLFRNTSSLSLLFLTAFLLLIFNPFYVENFSFLLSFLATLGLILGSRAGRLLLQALKLTPTTFLKKRIFNIFEGFVASLMVSLFVFPLILLIGGSFSLGTPLNNVIAGFFWGFIFIPLATFSALLVFLNQNLALKTALFLERAFSFYSKLPFLKIEFSPCLPVNLILFLYFLAPVLAFLFWKRVKSPIFAILKTGACLVLFYFFFLFAWSRIPMITLFDVGKGDAILIKLPSEGSSYYVLWDTGPNFGKKNGFNWTKFYLVPVFKKLGIKSIDLIVISHPDLDHSGGYSTIKKYFSVEEVVTSDFPEACWKKVNLKESLPYLTEPTVKKFGEAELFLYPGKEDRILSFKKTCAHLNSESLVGVLEYRGFTMLFTGDIDVNRFSRLIYQQKVFPSEVLISPHHGSRNGLNEFILKTVKPEVVLISGRGKYHPHPLTLRLLNRERIPYFITASSGAIYVFPKRSFFLVCEEKKRKKDFWAGLLFPLVPYYLDTMGCHRFNYHFAKGVEL